MSNLYLCASQEENRIAYEFNTTGIKVYSFEEALYHCLHHWRQSMEDFLATPFIQWMESLGLHHIAVKMRDLSAMENTSMAYLSFLSLVDYLPKESLVGLQKELTAWEKRHIWEKHKEQGDYWLSAGDGERAYSYYSRALKHQENVPLFNNAGMALLQAGDTHTATNYFTKALNLEPTSQQLRLNLIEAVILSGDFDRANELILSTSDRNHPELLYFQGEIQFHQRNFFGAMKAYQAALTHKSDPAYIYRISDCYMRVRQFEKALGNLEQIPENQQDLEFLKKRAAYQAQSGDLPQAIKSLERAVLKEKNQPDLWTALASYHRQDYDLTKAHWAISRAVAMSPESGAVLLEQARIRKAQGRTKEYQDILHKILTQFKKDYRKMR
ncbi:MAG: tetratricopeptide repeat protein [Defluviitaleaceae bacterium]|nr:tetratricopeptide repeat protein [Defluviitaleaceae bacterium]